MEILRRDGAAMCRATRLDLTRERLIASAALLLLFAAVAISTYAVFTSRWPGANDLLSRWEGARSFWVDGLNPYSDEVTERIQIEIYGRPARADEDPGPFAYPFYAVFTLLPLVWLPYAWAQAIWMTLLAFSIVALALMSMATLRWRVGPWALAGTILFSLCFYFSARAVFLGQFAVLVAAFVAGSFLAIRSGRDGWAGVLLALSTLKPQMIFLIAPYVLMWAVVRRRWRLVVGFTASMAILVGPSYALMPSWLGDFLRQLGNYTSYTAIGSPVWIIVQHYLHLGDAAEAIVAAVTGLALIGVWAYTLRRTDWGTFQWVCGLTLIVSNLIALRTATTNYVILYPALWLTAKATVDRWQMRGQAIVIAAALALLIGVWLLFSATVVAKFEHPLVYLPLPFGLAFVFVAWRRQLIDSAGQGR